MTVAGRLASKVALVTGGASGFGRAISHRFAAEGCRVVVGDINASGTKETIATSPGSPSNLLSAKFDVTSQADWKSAVSQAVDKWGQLDIVVNNAGWSYKNKPTLEVTDEEFDRVMMLNLKSIFYSVPAVIPQLKKQGRGGSIINVSSIGSERPRPGLVWYNASKAAVSNASRALAAEFGPDDIRVNAICPLISNTGLFEQFSGVPHTPENLAKLVAAVPLGRLTDPMDVANLALYLASDEGKFTTGQNLVLDGGKGI